MLILIRNLRMFSSAVSMKWHFILTLVKWVSAMSSTLKFLFNINPSLKKHYDKNKLLRNVDALVSVWLCESFYASKLNYLFIFLR